MARSREEEDDDDNKKRAAAQKRKDSESRTAARGKDDNEEIDPALADVDLSQPPDDISSPAPNPESAPGGDVVGMPPQEYAEVTRREGEIDKREVDEANRRAQERAESPEQKEFRKSLGTEDKKRD